MIKIIAIALLFSVTSYADDIPKYRCTSDSEKIERLTVTYQDANVHGELSFTYELEILNSQATRSTYWLDNAPTITPASYDAHFRDFKSTVDVAIKISADPHRTEEGRVVLNGEVIPVYCVALPSDIM